MNRLKEMIFREHQWVFFVFSLHSRRSPMCNPPPFTKTSFTGMCLAWVYHIVYASSVGFSMKWALMYSICLRLACLSRFFLSGVIEIKWMDAMFDGAVCKRWYWYCCCWWTDPRILLGEPENMKSNMKREWNKKYCLHIWKGWDLLEKLWLRFSVF